MKNKVIPVLRIFDYGKALEFYVSWLGFTIDWEHRFGENFPLYLQVSREHTIFHLSEHHGDCCPGAKIIVECDDLERYHATLKAKDYKYNKPGLEHEKFNALSMEVMDPFGNKIIFMERTESDHEKSSQAASAE